MHGRDHGCASGGADYWQAVTAYWREHRNHPLHEKIKVLPTPSRTENGRRQYGPTERRILAFVRRSRELGFSLDEVRTLLRLGGPEKASCREVREIAAHHLDDIRTKISDLRNLERL